MIKHIVFWKINKDGTDSDRRATGEGFLASPVCILYNLYI